MARMMMVRAGVTATILLASAAVPARAQLVCCKIQCAIGSPVCQTTANSNCDQMACDNTCESDPHDSSCSNFGATGCTGGQDVESCDTNCQPVCPPKVVCCKSMCANGQNVCQPVTNSNCDQTACNNACASDPNDSSCSTFSMAGCAGTQNASSCDTNCQPVCAPSQTPTITPSNTPTITPSATPTNTPTNTPTATPTNTGIPQGGMCSTPAACLTGFCVTGVCCDTACTDPAMRCNLAGQVGTCASTAAEAPTLTPWGLVVGALLLTGVAGFALRYRIRSR